MLIHGTVVDIAGLGVILLGESGAGKSDLALRLIEGGALLVADDQAEISVSSGTLWARAPRTIAGLVEARGVGIVAAPQKAAVRLVLAVELREPQQRLPDPRHWRLPGTSLQLPLAEIEPFAASAAEKLRRALAAVLPP